MKICNYIFFSGTGAKFAVVVICIGLYIFLGCNITDKDKKVSPPEDLMQEHGVLQRILLIYDACKAHLINNEEFPRGILVDAATTLQSFIEDYHEKQEEQYVFPRFKEAGVRTDLVDVLLQQHRVGRKITDRIIQLGKLPAASYEENRELVRLLTEFTSMYRVHSAREETVLFPVFREITSNREYDELGETFEDNEHKLFGKKGFETEVNKVAELEKALKIDELSKFTPSF